MLIDAELVARIEVAAALDAAAVAEQLAILAPQYGSRVLQIAGGRWVLFGRGMYVNRGLGLGMGVDVAVEDLVTAEAASDELGVDSELEVCPWARPSLLRLTADHGYRLDSFRSVLARPVPDGAELGSPDGVVISTVTDAGELAVWQEVSALGFGVTDAAAREVSDLYAAALVRSPNTRLQLAFIDGRPAGVAALTVRSGVATLAGMSTAPWARRRGVQRALVSHRLAAAAAAGCEIAVSNAVPGGASERNLLRLGCALLYTKVGLRRPQGD